ncbi:hypothetical protein L211DRAFT_895993 [Terfezia boudieri ATCC MYA-4762]|uniref:Uncharacterized protein n=1 Tax=Terfezia boudieri ATCC MYA-4762 TaxID=1051890 RepID=A0A3N4LE43_9PEZI|nr:hypothetical protein L211DRAFT_895993 [Terfezia boudieri ATCC MYA-4762]
MAITVYQGVQVERTELVIIEPAMEITVYEGVQASDTNHEYGPLVAQGIPVNSNTTLPSAARVNVSTHTFGGSFVPASTGFNFQLNAPVARLVSSRLVPRTQLANLDSEDSL